MASIRIMIDTDGPAFHEDHKKHGLETMLAVGHEIAQILRGMAWEFDADGEASVPRDSNGNVCGKVEVIE